MSDAQVTEVGEALVSTHHLEFPGGYTRTLGPVIGAFLTGLRDGRFVGVRTAAGRVLCPPQEYDPDTGEPVGELVEVGPGGTVLTWAWEAAPRSIHPRAEPFAWVLVRLDGADSALLHVLDAPSAGAVRSGMRVAPRWRAERVGHIRDLECFVAESAR